MAAEVFKSDVNEILLGYYILGSTWNGFQDEVVVKNQLSVRSKQLDKEEYEIQEERAKYWLGKGAQPSSAVNRILTKQGILKTENT